MSITLELDNDYRDVSCPNCGHKWWVKQEYGPFNKTIFCPKCNAPLKAPSVRLTDLSHS